MVGAILSDLGPFKGIESNQAMLEHGYIHHEHLPLETRDGRKLIVEFVANVCQADDKKVIQCNIRDVTTRKNTEDEMRSLNARLEQDVIESKVQLQAAEAALNSRKTPDFSRDPRRKKLALTFGVMAIGMVIAICWHGWEGWGQGQDYPYNTFLFPPSLRFGDLMDPYGHSALPSPYQNQFSIYFPFAYVVLRWLAYFHLLPLTLSYLYVVLVSMGLFATLVIALRPITYCWMERSAYAAGLLACSYPFLMGLDRANLELMVDFFIAGALLYFRKQRWVPGLIFLLPAICLKAYPILLMALFLRPKHWVKIPIVMTAFLAISLGCLVSFAETIEENWRLWQNNLATFKELYVIQNWGFSGSAGAWNVCKALMIVKDYVVHSTVNDVLPVDQLHFAYDIYLDFVFGMGLLALIYVILIEREFFRRAVLLLLVVIFAPPSSGDYKLVLAQIALMTFILLPTQRRHDLWITALLAFVLVPKKEILLPFLGPTDSGGTNDVAVGILINPLCILIAMGLLIRDGFQPAIGRYIGRRFFWIISPIGLFVVKGVRKALVRDKVACKRNSDSPAHSEGHPR